MADSCLLILAGVRVRRPTAISVRKGAMPWLRYIFMAARTEPSLILVLDRAAASREVLPSAQARTARNRTRARGCRSFSSKVSWISAIDWGLGRPESDGITQEQTKLNKEQTKLNSPIRGALGRFWVRKGRIRGHSRYDLNLIPLIPFTLNYYSRRYRQHGRR